jgi:hypothetical protein
MDVDALVVFDPLRPSDLITVDVTPPPLSQGVAAYDAAARILYAAASSRLIALSIDTFEITNATFSASADVPSSFVALHFDPSRRILLAVGLRDGEIVVASYNPSTRQLAPLSRGGGCGAAACALTQGVKSFDGLTATLYFTSAISLVATQTVPNSAIASTLYAQPFSGVASMEFDEAKRRIVALASINGTRALVAVDVRTGAVSTLLTVYDERLQGLIGQGMSAFAREERAYYFVANGRVFAIDVDGRRVVQYDALPLSVDARRWSSLTLGAFVL